MTSKGQRPEQALAWCGLAEEIICKGAYDLSAYLANILSPLRGKSEYTVTSSAHFVSTVSNETILDDEIMVSFDVESLFTNVPIDAVVEAALQKVENDPSLANSITLTPARRYRDLCCFRACPKHRIQAPLEQSKVYLSWLHPNNINRDGERESPEA